MLRRGIRRQLRGRRRARTVATTVAPTHESELLFFGYTSRNGKPDEWHGSEAYVNEQVKA